MTHSRKALVLYWVAGYPSEERTLEVVRVAHESGVDLMEMGVPFSDPMADGPVIQAASHAALARGMTVGRVLSLVARARGRTSLRFYVMSYLNPLLAYGLPRFVREARRAGVEGLIVPDMNVDNVHTARVFRGAPFPVVQFAAPTSSPARLRRIAKATRGFLYAVSVAGVTGPRRGLAPGLLNFLRQVGGMASVPVYVGFGFSTPAQVRRVAPWCDGVILGSAALRVVQEGGRTWAVNLRRLLGSCRRALDQA